MSFDDYLTLVASLFDDEASRAILSGHTVHEWWQLYQSGGYDEVDHLYLDHECIGA